MGGRGRGHVYVYVCCEWVREGMWRRVCVVGGGGGSDACACTCTDTDAPATASQRHRRPILPAKKIPRDLLADDDDDDDNHSNNNARNTIPSIAPAGRTLSTPWRAPPASSSAHGTSGRCSAFHGASSGSSVSVHVCHDSHLGRILASLP